MELKNSFCGDKYEKTSWTSLSEAAEKCDQDDSCTMFYDDCGNGTYWKCPGSVMTFPGDITEMEGGCGGTTLYKRGNILNSFIY